MLFYAEAHNLIKAKLPAEEKILFDPLLCNLTKKYEDTHGLISTMREVNNFTK